MCGLYPNVLLAAVARIENLSRNVIWGGANIKTIIIINIKQRCCIDHVECLPELKCFFTPFVSQMMKQQQQQQPNCTEQFTHNGIQNKKKMKIALMMSS